MITPCTIFSLLDTHLLWRKPTGSDISRLLREAEAMDYQIEEEVRLFIESSCFCTFFLSHTLNSRADYVSLKAWLEGCVALLALTALFFHSTGWVRRWRREHNHKRGKKKKKSCCFFKNNPWQCLYFLVSPPKSSSLGSVGPWLSNLCVGMTGC